MLRGLFGNWKQPIFYEFDYGLKKDKLFEIIQFVESSGFPIVAMVSDMGGSNRALRNELGISTTKSWFINPVNNQKIYVFADVPHLIKLIRNNFLDHGFYVYGKEIDKTIIEKLLNVTGPSDLTIAHKILRDSLAVAGPQRQKVKTATKLLSHTISRAITRCGTLGYFQNENWVECAQFFKEVNDWFDVLNVRCPEADSRDRVKAFGLAIDTQLSIVNKITETISNMRVKWKKSLMAFQKGIIISNNSLKLLFEDIKTRFGAEYILTYRLNQDVLENFFGTIRAKGGLYDAPDPLEFKYRLRAYILGRYEGSLSNCGNVEEDSTPDLSSQSNESNLSA